MRQSPRQRHYCLKVSLIPIGLILAFSTVLVSLDLLGSPVNPARNQHLGWQSWDIVRYPRPVPSSGTKAGGDSTSSLWDSGTTQDDDNDDLSSFAPSLPLHHWDPLLRHTTGITEVAAVPCLFPPWLYPKVCSPPTTGEQDKLKGKWVRVERDLNLQTGLYYLNIYYRRTRRYDVPLITDIVLLDDGASPPGHVNLSQYTMSKGNYRDGVWPQQKKLRLWYKTKRGNQPGAVKGIHYRREATKAGSETREWSHWDTDLDEEEPQATDTSGSSSSSSVEAGSQEDQDEIITEIDVLYGQGRPSWDFQRVKNGPVVEAVAKKHESVDIVVRRGNPVAHLASPPQFHANGRFKILQVADLHFSVSQGECRDTGKSPCVGDVDTLSLMEKMLDEEKPDMVVFTGDQLNGQETSWDAKSVIAKVVGPVIDRKIPWTAIFGNHDSEIANDRAEQMKYMQTLPYSLAEPGPKDVDGVGNYAIKLYSQDASRVHLFTLYFLDAHARQKPRIFWEWPDYDYLKPSQIEWYLNTSASINAIERPFTPDGGNDLGKIWARRAEIGKARLGRQEQQTTLAKPNAMMFFHIPLNESYGPIDIDEMTGEAMDIGTELNGDSPGSSQTNGGFFQLGLLQAPAVPPEVQDEATPSSQDDQFEVKVVGHGHCHNTDKCRRNNGIWFCFGGGGSYSGYGSIGFDRRYRVYELSDFGETVTSWKRTENNEVIEKQILVSDGKSAALRPLDSV